MNYFYPRKLGGTNSQWVTMDEFLEAKLVVELCAKYMHVPLPLVKMEIKIKLELHVNYTAIDAAKAIQTRDGIGHDYIKSSI